MDPFTAIGLAGNIAQFIDFAAKLFKATYQIHSTASGLKSDNASLESLTADLLALSQSIRDSTLTTSSTPPNMSTRLLRLATSCQETSDELLDVIKKLKPSKSGVPWQSFRAALKSIWKQQKIDSMSSRLDSYRVQLTLELQYLQSLGIEKSLGRLWDENVQIKADLGMSIRELRAEITTLLQQLISDLKKKPNNANMTLQKPGDHHSGLTLTERVCKINEHGQVIFRRMEVLKSLYFTGMEFRYSKVAMAHQDTYQWVYESKFKEWAANDTPVFWISGKPGSGKSTLMKYLIQNSMTWARLEEWAEPRKLSILNYFFWISGSKLQRSQEGLLRSIIFDLLRQNPHLIDGVTPSAYSLSTAVNILSLQSHDPFKNEWTFDSLLLTLKNIVQQLQDSNKICVFIDGLDEYDGDHTTLIEFLKRLQCFSSLKLCVASRPWNIFESAFGSDHCNKIYMQDLTKGDIESYIKDKLEGHEAYQKLISDSETSDAQDIVAEIVTKAQGVFLWVSLVVKSLIVGLQNMDRMLDLRRRLRAFPSDLNDYFGYILHSLDPIYRFQIAKGFEAALSAQQPLSVMQFWYLDLEEEDPEYAMKMKALDKQNLSPFRGQECARIHHMTKRINARFKGLLEVTEQTSETVLVKTSYGEEITIPQRKVVDFLHRTVRDFLLTKDCQDTILSSLPETFDVNLSLCRAYLADLKASYGKPECRADRETVDMIFVGLFGSAERSTSRTSRHNLQKILHEVDRIANMRGAFGSSGDCLWNVLDAKSFMLYAIHQGARRFVATVLPSKFLTSKRKSEYLRQGFLASLDPTIVRDMAPIGPHASLHLHNCPVIPISDIPPPFSDYDEMFTLVKELCYSGVLTVQDFDVIYAWFTGEEQTELQEILSNRKANVKGENHSEESKRKPKRTQRKGKSKPS